MKVIKINGLRGVIFVIFCLCCLVTGFVFFPSWACMHIWNAIANYFYQMPKMELIHGVLLWAIIALSLYVTHTNKSFVDFQKVTPKDDKFMESLMKKIQDENQQAALNENLTKNEADNIQKQ